MNRKIVFSIAAVIIILVLIISCDENPFHPEKKSRLKENEPPETFLFLFTAKDTSTVSPNIDTTASRQVLHWWGDDIDGQVIGYYIQWDYQPEPVWTTSEFDTFYVPIKIDYDQFTFKVWAVDDDSTMDPTPAVQTFPVYNSHPGIEFKHRSNPEAPAGNPNVTSYTFPTRTFMWDVFDPDGVETITKILYALDDTSSWSELPGNERSIMLTDLEPGEHRFFAKAEDVAGARSNVISFPDPDNENVPNRWIVKEPKGDILLVDDYAQDQNTRETQGYYKNILNNIVGENGYSVWEIGTTIRPVINPQNSIPFATADVKAYLNYFKKVIWFSHMGRPNLSEAGLSLTQYIANGGYVFITNGNLELPDTSWTFTDIDTVLVLNPGGRMFRDTKVLASFTNTAQDSVYDMSLGKLIGNRVWGLIPGPNATVVYRMEPDSTATVFVPYKGSPAVGLRYEVGLGKSIYFSLPLPFCDGNGNMESIIRYILEEEFK